MRLLLHAVISAGRYCGKKKPILETERHLYKNLLRFFFFFHFTDLEQPNDFLLKYAASMKLRKGSFLLFTEKTELH